MHGFRIIFLGSVLLFSTYSQSQQIRFFLGGELGSSVFYQDQIIPYATELDIVKVENKPSYQFAFSAVYQRPDAIWAPACNLSVLNVPFDLKLNGSDQALATVFGSYDVAENNISQNYFNVPFVQLGLSNKFTLYYSKPFRIIGYGEIGLNKVYRSGHTPVKLSQKFSVAPQEESDFYAGFKSHLYVKLGLQAEIIRHRLGFSVSYLRNLTPVYDAGLIGSLTSIHAGVSYNFSNLNLLKLQARRKEKSSSVVLNQSGNLFAGIRLNFPITGNISTTGLRFLPSGTGQGEIKYQSGNFTLERDFPILPAIYLRKPIVRGFDLELVFSMHAHYYTIQTTTITPTETRQDYWGSSIYAQYAGFEWNAIYTMLHKKENNLALLLGINLWKTAGTNEISSFINANMGLQYSYNRLSFRTVFQTNLNNVVYRDMVGDMQLHHFRFFEFSIAYDVYKFGQKK